MLGTKTLFSGALLAVGLALMWWGGLFGPDAWSSLESTTLFSMALCACIGGTLFFRFAKFNQPSGFGLALCRGRRLWAEEAHFLGTSRWRLTIAKNGGTAIDLPARVHHGIALLLAFGLALATIDARAIDLLGQAPEKLRQMGTDTCPEDEDDETPPAAKPGCALVRRAFALGYIDALGACAAEDPKSQQSQVCTLRQHDEPLLHFNWRLWRGAMRAAEEFTEPAYWRARREDFTTKTAHLDSLLYRQRNVVASPPLASVHLWTNLPRPHDWLGALDLGHEKCAKHYQGLSGRPPLGDDGPLRSSRIFSHMLGQLLYDNQYEPPVTRCDELTIHWDAPADACSRMQQSDNPLLRESGVVAAMEQITELHRIAVELRALGWRLDPARMAVAPIAKLSAVVGLFCYMEAESPTRPRTSHHVIIAGTSIAVRQVEVERPGPGLPVEQYHALARLFSPDFLYTAMHSHSPAGVEFSRKKNLGYANGYLATLENLQEDDAYLLHSTSSDTTDLLAVYPYAIHLSNFVRTFRQGYPLRRL